jgi:predicted nuclease of predicted toxin-antitoxin system
MKLLLDANLSWRLVPTLTKHFGECVHVNQTALPRPAPDIQIWDYAKENGYSIVTQDTDFLHFLAAKGYPPKIVLLRTGNIGAKNAGEILLQAKQSIMELEEKEIGLLEILWPGPG